MLDIIIVHPFVPSILVGSHDFISLLPHQDHMCQCCVFIEVLIAKQFIILARRGAEKNK